MSAPTRSVGLPPPPTPTLRRVSWGPRPRRSLPPPGYIVAASAPSAERCDPFPTGNPEVPLVPPTLTPSFVMRWMFRDVASAEGWPHICVGASSEAQGGRM